MTGEIQPGDRAPAPGELALVQSFINSHYDLEVEHGADLFATPDALAAWLRRRGLLGSGESLEAADARSARAVREALRSIAGANGDPDRSAPRHAIAALDGAARGVAVGIRFTGGEPRFVAASGAGLGGATPAQSSLSTVPGGSASAVNQASNTTGAANTGTLTAPARRA